jgi:hypothetical protein
MRFCHKSLTIFVLCFLAFHADAGEDPSGVGKDHGPAAKAAADSRAAAVIDADSLVGQKDNQIEATGNAILRQVALPAKYA